jgi:hypothetical protein
MEYFLKTSLDLRKTMVFKRSLSSPVFPFGKKNTWVNTNVKN